ncbi:MAG: ATP-binding protein, partial [Verrucomicrobiota bacterium]
PSLANAISHVELMLTQVRNLSLSLRPPMLDDFGLPAALRWLADQHTKTTGRPVTCDLTEYHGRPEPMLETACFRIAQEALTNISRHSGAQNVNVVLQSDAENFTLVVRDDGVGFDFNAAAARAHEGNSLGLLGQQERAALVGGKVEIISRPGAGTEVRAQFPLGTNPDLT